MCGALKQILEACFSMKKFDIFNDDNTPQILHKYINISLPFHNELTMFFLVASMNYLTASQPVYLCASNTQYTSKKKKSNSRCKLVLCKNNGLRLLTRQSQSSVFCVTLPALPALRQKHRWLFHQCRPPQSQPLPV